MLNWNGWSDTVECVESLLRSSPAPEQIVVVDNASTDGSLARLMEWAEGLILVESIIPAESEWAYRPASKPIAYTIFRTPGEALTSNVPLETPLVFIQSGENLGYAGGNNVGLLYALQRSQCEFVWILNNDTVVDRHALKANVQLAQSDTLIGIVGAKVVQYERPLVLQAMGGGRLIPSLGYDSQLGSGSAAGSATGHPMLLEHVVGASLFVRSSAIAGVGWLSEEYFLYREETDWCIRMRQHNWKLYYCPSAVVWHKQGRSIGHKSAVHDYYSVRNMFLMIRKHHPSALPSALLVVFVKAVVPKLFRLQFKRLASVLRAFNDFFRGNFGRQHTDAELLAERRR
ncbi:MAG: glycosyltransferase family 2 protein [Vulcanimicrobiaceae bacterium]